MIQKPKFAVIGGGSWATAIAKMLCVNLPEIAWYMRNQEAIDHIIAHKHNP
ncbi:MAG: glycerol-3-phosphate dehydrogenase, partial [Flavobacterium sp.]|nr:glycerol-3-phosphate dehydrogenase [Flavobacterium sp.]